jgi:hypothetical protein
LRQYSWLTAFWLTPHALSLAPFLPIHILDHFQPEARQAMHLLGG